MKEIKIPNNIKVAIKNTAKHTSLGKENSEKVRNWLRKNNLYNEFNLNFFIDSCESGVNEPDEFIQFLTTNAEKGNENRE